MKKPQTLRQRAWTSSAASREIGRQQCLKLNAVRWAGPRCGANRKRDGEPCENPPLANGRCRLHGGASPKGRRWHMPRWPDAAAPDATEKAERKIRDREKASRKRAARLAAMTPEERAAHEAWHRTHKPGDPGQRAAERERRRQGREARALLEGGREPKPVSAERAAVAAEIAELKRRLAEVQAPTPWSIFD